MSFSKPILFIIFNRSNTAIKVFGEIKKIKPKYLFIAADGHRKNVLGEKERCEEARKNILAEIDWDCELKTLFRENNLGCRVSVSSAIDWFFSQVEEGIIMEDDCLPDLSFFNFCAEMLNKYRDNKEVAMISGDNFQFERKKEQESYYFSRYGYIWGWATWKDRWSGYDVDMIGYQKSETKKILLKIWGSRLLTSYWLKKFSKVYSHKIDTWDYQLTYYLFKNNLLAIIPNKNLITNIGFNENATHTKWRNKLANLKSSPMVWPLTHPDKVLWNKDADNYYNKHFVLQLTPQQIVKKLLKWLILKPLTTTLKVLHIDYRKFSIYQKILYFNNKRD